MALSTVTTEARAEILRRARHALAAGPSVAPATSAPPTRPIDETGHDVERFAERVADYRATVLHTTEDGVEAAISQTIGDWGGGRIVVPHGFPTAWLPDSTGNWQSDDPPLTHRQLDALDGALTLCALGIAETGTIVLDGGSGQGRRALSLVPDRHLCVIRCEQVVADVPDAIERLNPHRPLTWISGPSATSDIELQRVEGVHGPRTLVVVIVQR